MLGLFRRKRPVRAPAAREPGSLRFRAAPDVQASLHPDGVVLIHHGKGTVFSANRVGSMIWNGAVERWTLEKVADSISAEFHVPQRTVEQDAARFLAELEAEGLLVPDPN